VTEIVTDPRATQYWDGHRVLNRRLRPDAGVERPVRRDLHVVWTTGSLGGRDASEARLPEDAHAQEFNRP